jgi:hypothetical protein
MQAKIDSFEPYLDPKRCSNKFRGSLKSDLAVNIVPSKPGSSKLPKSSPPKIKLRIPRDPPLFDIGKLPNLDESELNEAEAILELIDSFTVDTVTPEQTYRFVTLMRKAYAGSGFLNVLFSPKIVASWKEYRLSDAYDFETYFEDYQEFKEWWKAVNRDQQGEILAIGHEQSLAEKQAIDSMHRSTGGKTITPDLQRLIDQEHEDEHTSAFEDGQSGQEEQTLRDMPKTFPDPSQVGQKRAYDMAFETNSHSTPPTQQKHSSHRSSDQTVRLEAQKAAPAIDSSK